MTFTNISSSGIYLTCCHREVAPQGTFSVPWESARRDRGLRAAMNAGVLAWRSDAGEAGVPGSPPVPDFDAARRAREAEEARAAAEESRRVREAEAAADRDVKANMSRRGRYDVPQPVKREAKSHRVRTEKPVTREDVIRDRPKSLDDIRRHNRAVHRFGA